MAIYHLEAKVISRGSGRSAVAAAAYMSCSEILNDYDGVRHDYTRKRGLVWEQIFLPDHAPRDWMERGTLWNTVEENEKTKDSRLAREFVVAMPIELGREDWKHLVSDFIREQLVADGMCADVCIHDTDGHNPHAHIMATVRPLNDNGQWQYKTEKEYLCIRNGEEQGFTGAEFKQALLEGWEKQYRYKVGSKKQYLPPSEAEVHGYERISKTPKSTRFGRQNPISARWNSDEQLFKWREAWADYANRYLEKIGSQERIDHRSHKDRGLPEQPTIHEGVKARRIEASGGLSDRCEMNRQIKADNKILRELRSAYRKIVDTVMHTVPGIARALEGLREKMILIRYRFRSIRIERYRTNEDIEKIKPALVRYTALAEQIKEKTKERKTLLKEKKDTPIYKVGTLRDLSRRIAELTEELEELKSEKELLLQILNCPEENQIPGIKKDIEALESHLQKLQEQEANYATELDQALQEYQNIKAQIPETDSIEVMTERLKIRPEQEQAMIQSVKTAHYGRYDSLLLHGCTDDVDELLDEFHEEQKATAVQRKQRNSPVHPTTPKQTR